MTRKHVLMSVLAIAGALSAAVPAQADAVIVSGNGNVFLGVTDYGNLGPGTGLSLAGVGDGINPGCFCEGWGVAVASTGNTGYANISTDGYVNLTVDSFTSTATTATSIVHLSDLPGLKVTQAYGPSASGALFKNLVTITNTTTGTLNDVRYTRVMDWDIPPTEFSEYVTVGGLPAKNLLYSDDNGFASANPLGGRSPILGGTTNTNFTDSGPADHGAVFDLGFGDLAAGASVSFNIFYGATYNEKDAFAALAAVGAEVYSLGQSDGGQESGEPGTFIWAFSGVGGTALSAVPEPATIILLGIGVMGLGARKFQRKAAA